MFYYKLIDNQNKIVLSNLPEYKSFLSDKCGSPNEVFRYEGEKCRRGKIKKHDIGEAFLMTSDIDEVNSSRIFKKKIDLYLNFIEEIKNIKNDILSLILHDITKINAHCIQELYHLVPETIFKTKSYDKQIAALELHLVSNKNNNARGLFKIYRDIINLKTECSSLKYQFSKTIEVDKKNHDIYNAIKPSLHVRMPELFKKGVIVEIDDKSSKGVNINFEYLESAMIPLLDNITKYILHNSKLLIYFANTIDGYAINFDMVSMAIKKEERDKLFINGYSGSNAVKNKINGKGIGMTKIKDSLFVNNAELRINIDVNKKVEKRYRNTNYERNVFQIVFLDQKR